MCFILVTQELWDFIRVSCTYSIGSPIVNYFFNFKIKIVRKIRQVSNTFPMLCTTNAFYENIFLHSDIEKALKKNCNLVI
jgi:hypothetical protein